MRLPGKHTAMFAVGDQRMMCRDDYSFIRVPLENIFDKCQCLRCGRRVADVSVLVFIPMVKKPLCIENDEDVPLIEVDLNRSRTPIARQQGDAFIMQGIQPGLLTANVLQSLPAPMLPVVISGNEDGACAQSADEF